MHQGFVRLRDFIAYGVGSLLLVLILLSVAVRIQDWIFRNRAERLFAEIQSIDSHQTTFQQVGSIFERWHGSVSYPVPCSKEYCDFGIDISEPITWRNNSKLVPMLLDFYRALGGHPAIIRATIKVRNGLVWTKGYSLAIEAPPVVGAGGRSYTYYLEGNILTEPQTVDTSSSVGPGMGRFPDYQIGSNACLGCLEIHVSFSPSANSVDVKRLSQINFSCLTRQRPCRTRADIMPTAASESSVEKHPSGAPS